MLTPALRQRFDSILDELVAALPEDLHALLEEAPLIVEDNPSPKLLESMGVGRGTLLCGLYQGVSQMDRSVDQTARLPDHMMLFREPIIRVSGFGRGGNLRDLEEQIHITLMHEIGHHFGLDEDDLAAVGFG